MERRDCQVAVYFLVALAASVALGLVIAYLEVKRSEEILSIEVKWLQEMDKMQREIDALRDELDNRTIRLSESITDLQQNQPDPEDDYYADDYEEYDDEDVEEDGAGGKEDGTRKKESGGKRNKRDIRLNPLLPPYNLILKQFKPPTNKTESPEVKAQIIVSTNQEHYQIQPEAFDAPKKSNLGDGVAIHFLGDTSRIRHRHSSRCYDANHRMCHVRGVFMDWKPAEWSNRQDGTFTMIDGELTLYKYPGIYFLYSQIFYADNHDVNGYRVFVNGEPVFQCTLTHLHDERWIPSRVPHIKNSCYTGGLIRLHEGDRVTIREIDNVERYSVFEPYKSYFGLYRVVPLASDRSRR